jgi:hypothetical protein
MQAFFIGQSYVDVTFLTDRMPTGDESQLSSHNSVTILGASDPYSEKTTTAPVLSSFIAIAAERD